MNVLIVDEAHSLPDDFWDAVDQTIKETRETRERLRGKFEAIHTHYHEDQFAPFAGVARTNNLTPDERKALDDLEDDDGE